MANIIMYYAGFCIPIPLKLYEKQTKTNKLKTEKKTHKAPDLSSDSDTKFQLI